MSFPKLPILLICVLYPCVPAVLGAPVKMAAAARFDLSGSTEVEMLKEGAVLQESGSMQRPSWLSGGQQSRAYTVEFPIERFRTNEITVTFVAAKSGSVTLSLMGPWEEQSTGVLFQQEILWDTLRVTGASFTGPGWERIAKPARTWHNQPLQLRLAAAAGRPITIAAAARPVIPPGFGDMKRILVRDTPAHQAALKFRRGANLGNYLETPRNQNWGVTYSEQDFVRIRAEGFDHVRLPMAWQHYTSGAPQFEVSPEMYAKADFLVTNALKNQLNVIVNIHHFDEFTSNPTALTNKFYALWRQVAAHYAKAPEGVAFELLNEPKDGATTSILNPVYAETIRLIRTTNPRRPIFLGPGQMNQVSELTNLRLPDEDANVIVTVHCYDPFYFTHQGASWAGPDTKVTGIVFPGPPSVPLTPNPALQIRPHVLDWIKRYNTLPTVNNPCSPLAFRSLMQRAKAWSDYYGRPVHVGEFGCYTSADSQSRARFYAAFRQTLDEFQLGWAVWDWKAGFKYWDESRNQPAPGMREALFPAASR